MNLKVDDARYILFAEPADLPPTPDLPTRAEADALLASDAEYAEWQAKQDAEMHADFDAEMSRRYAEYCETQHGKIAMASDKADKEVSKCL